MRRDGFLDFSLGIQKVFKKDFGNNYSHLFSTNSYVNCSIITPKAELHKRGPKNPVTWVLSYIDSYVSFKKSKTNDKQLLHP